jgi:serine/threonine-protein phosphatase PP1 catalytic subunit
MAGNARLDRIIHSCLAAESLPRDTHIQFEESDLLYICTEAVRVLRADPVLLRLEAPMVVCGDIHGQFYDLLTFMKLGGAVPVTHYLFLGDYVDRGRYGIEVFTLLLAFKIKYPSYIFLLRGNHETRDISKLYGFYDECVERYRADVWDRFTDVFMWLPIAAIISERIFCVHGGLSPELHDLAQLSKLNRPLAVPTRGLLADLLWSDPDPEQRGWAESTRGISYTYGEAVVEDFIAKNDFDLICRAHQIVPSGYEFPFAPNQSVLTVFSAPGMYDEHGRVKGAMLKVDEALQCSFTVIEAPEEGKKA